MRNPASASAGEAAARFAVEVRAGNVLEPATLGEAMAGCDAVIHLVGIISEVGDQTFENVHTRATHNVVAAAKRIGVRRFIYMSALGTRPGAVGPNGPPRRPSVGAGWIGLFSGPRSSSAHTISL